MNQTVKHRLEVSRVLLGTGMIRPTRPDRAARAIAALHRWGPTPAAAYSGSAARYPERHAIVDDRGVLTFEQVQKRSNALARSLATAGVRQGDGIAIMCRNHRGFIEATVACSKLGVDALYLNTSFAGPQITDVMRRENPKALIYDEEFAELVHDGGDGRQRFVSWCEPRDGGAGTASGGAGTAALGTVSGGAGTVSGGAGTVSGGAGTVSGGAGTASGVGSGDPTLEQLIAAGSDSELTPPTEKGRVVILTSGTTGTPKGASRKQPESLDPAAALFSKIPLKARESTVIAAPLFHSWGFAHFTLALPLASTLVLRTRFDPEETLKAVSQHGATALVVVPVMLQRMLELPAETLDRYDLSTLRVIAASGSALPGELAIKTMDRFGEVLYNLYGSTEVAWASIATPADLRAAPGTAGKPPLGTVVKLLDDDGQEVPRGHSGRIFVANEMVFEGYTGGGNKEIVSGLMSTGDVGHIDDGGRLFVDGRDDEMIVSGGENVFPREVEDLLADHPNVDEAAIIGVEDAQFGQRLVAFVVTRSGAKLSAEDVQTYVKQNLARYKVPRDVFFLDALPRNATGKVLKRELAAESAPAES